MIKNYQPLDVKKQQENGTFSFKYLLFVAFSIVISSFLFGFHGAIMNTPQNVITKCYIDHMTPGNITVAVNQMGLPLCIPMENGLWGLVVSMFAVGALIGSIVGGFFVARIGRRYSLMGTNLFLIIGSFLIAFGSNVAALIFGRLLVGFGIGVSAMTVTLYIVEVCPLKYRGTFGSLPQFFNGMGLVLTGIVGMQLSTLYTWRTIFLIAIIPSLLQTVLLIFCPESPEFLRIMHRHEELALVSAKLGLETKEEDNSENRKMLTIAEVFKRKDLKRSLEIAIMLQVIQQFIGINAVVYYSTSIFSSIFPNHAALATVALCVVNVLMTGISVLLMDRAGRRILLIFSLSGIALSLSVLVVGFVSKLSLIILLSLVGFMAAFALGAGPIPWLMMGELFPADSSSSAVSIGCATNWSGTIIIGLLFPLIQQSLGNYSFLPFALISYGSILYAIRRVPETKGRNINSLLETLNA